MSSVYNGPIRLVVTDLAGTAVDYGSCAPAGAFAELFECHGVPITSAEARAPMGLQKRDHIVALTETPRIAEAWMAKHGSAPDESLIDNMYQEFVSIQVECLPNFDNVIPGVLETIEAFHARDILVAATTGYNREMLEVVLAGAAKHGFQPDFSCCAEDVPQGRPAPWMIYRSMEALGVFPAAAVVNLGDTLPDVESGYNARTWNVGVTRTGNMLGLDLDSAKDMPEEKIQPLLEEASARMQKHGAHTTIEAFADCLSCIDDFESRLAAGEQP